MSRALVTGGSGFVGGRVISRLLADGWAVRALARSEHSERTVAERGAEPAAGDITDERSVREAAGGCELCVHAAAELGAWGERERFERVNVEGTRTVMEACREAGVRRVVHVSTEAVTMAGRPLVRIDETAPLRPDSPAVYCATKARAEQVALATPGIEVVALRPRFVWGAGDTTLLPEIVEQVHSGVFAWIGGGRHLTSTTHVDNAVEGIVLAAERGRPGRAYFVTDGEPVRFRPFITELLATQGVEAPDRTLPRPLASLAARAAEAAWRVLPLRGEPPLTRIALWIASQEQTIDISRAREELSYEPVRSIPEGMRELREAHDARTRRA